MKKYNLLTPEGTRDMLFDECAALRSVGDRLKKIFVSHGYSEVITPGLEFFDVFSVNSAGYSQEELYKLTDAKGRLMVLRPDSTTPIARLMGTRLSGSVLPLKLFYEQTIYRANPKDSGRDDEFYQSGIEIIGGDVERADMEALSIAAEVMESFDEDDYRFEIGDSAFFTMLSSKLKLSEQELDKLREFVLSKNYPALEEMLSVYGDDKYAKALMNLPRLFGGREIFDIAENVLPEETGAVLEKLRRFYENVCRLGIEDKVTLDLSIVSKNGDYYTGIVFKGYVESYGMPVLTGGRYDNLISGFGTDTPATGFAVNENAVAAALLRKSGGMLMPQTDVLIFAEDDAMTEAVRHCRELINSGLIAEYADFRSADDARKYAAEKGIKRFDIVSKNEIKTNV